MSKVASRKIVTDASKLPQSSDPKEILSQVEFYFSDNNLPTDRFLWQATQKNDGWVSIELIHSFKRMHRFQPYEAVVEALRQSPDLLEVSEDGKQVRRKIPLVEPKAEAKKEAFKRTVYAKGFGEETPTSQFDIEKFFGEHGSTKQVRLRRAEDGTFKGSVFAEFENLDDAKKFVEAESKPKWDNKELLVMSKQAYVDMKSAEHGFTDSATGKRRRGFNAFNQKQPQPKKRRFEKKKVVEAAPEEPSGDKSEKVEKVEKTEQEQEESTGKEQEEKVPQKTDEAPQKTDEVPQKTDEASNASEEKSK